MVTIVILNYKGWQDTIACLASLQQQTMQDFRVVVADNGSQDESLEQITLWAQESPLQKRLTLLPFNENYGFAKGNNLAIEAVKDQPTDYFWCLNNDTVVTPDCLERLVNYMDTHQAVSVATPAIRLYDQPDTLWNAGGRLVFGGRRYFGAWQPAAIFEGKHELPITFVTGCALLVRKEMVDKEPLFTEQFFFGEEDFEFSLRMQKENKKMVCLLDAVIYHKVSATSNKMPSYNKLFIHTLNRAINLKHHYSPLAYWIWKTLYFPYTRLRFLKPMSAAQKKHFMTLLASEASQNKGVNKALFDKYIHYDFNAQ